MLVYTNQPPHEKSNPAGPARSSREPVAAACSSRLQIRKSIERGARNEQLRARPRGPGRHPQRGYLPLVRHLHGHRFDIRIHRTHQGAPPRRHRCGRRRAGLHVNPLHEGEHLGAECGGLQPRRRQGGQDTAQEAVHLRRTGERQSPCGQVLDSRSPRGHGHRIPLPTHVGLRHLHPLARLPARHSRHALQREGRDSRVLPLQPLAEGVSEHQHLGVALLGFDSRHGRHALHVHHPQHRLHGREPARTAPRALRMVSERLPFYARIRTFADCLPHAARPVLLDLVGRRERRPAQDLLRQPLPDGQPLPQGGR